MAERVRVREIDDDEGQRLLRIIRRGSGSVVTWRRAQTVPLSAQGMPVAKIAEVTLTSADRVRDMIHNFNADGFDFLRSLLEHDVVWAAAGNPHAVFPMEPKELVAHAGAALVDVCERTS